MPRSSSANAWPAPSIASRPASSFASQGDGAGAAADQAAKSAAQRSRHLVVTYLGTSARSRSAAPSSSLRARLAPATTRTTDGVPPAATA
ncbi:MAG TPA: hypothetical protein VGR41_04125 [Actinomycetota bacterium]|jgi:hypothetical protein|nr:hypothetical protein [Actinomycetota bacterium]